MDNFDVRKFLVENKLTRSSINLNEVSIDMLKQQFVDSGKINQKEFKEITDVANNDSALATWLVSRVVGTKKVQPLIKIEDIYKYKKYFDIFKRNKQKYPLKDINMIKDRKSLDDFIKKSVEISQEEEQDISKQTGVSKAEKYKKLKLGEVDGFEIYKIPQGEEELYGASCELGSGTEWCTATGKSDMYFQNYIEDGPLYIIINKSNPKEKYQFHYESNSFMDKDDVSLYDSGF